MADNMHFASREKLEVFIRQNPKRFLEELERSPDLRNNFQQLLQDWNNGDLIQIAQLLQGMEVRNPINNKLMIVEEKAKSFYHWSFNELREVQQNPYHKLTSFQHYLQETMKKREELEEEEEKARLKKDKEHKIQTKLDKEKLEQEKRNMDMIMSTTKSQFKQALQGLFKDMDKQAVEQFSEDVKHVLDDVRENPEHKQFMLNWEKSFANILKGYPDADKLSSVTASIGVQMKAATLNEESYEELIALYESFGMKKARDIFKRMRNGTVTNEDIKEIQKTTVIHIDDPRLEPVLGNTKDLIKGNPVAIQNQENMLNKSFQIISEANRKGIALFNILNNTTSDVSQNDTDINENYHIKGEKLR